jgi:hypothetical protein
MGWFRGFVPRTKNLPGANNAVLAEHALSLVELVPENPFARELARTIIQTLRPLTSSEDRIVKTFNGEKRLIQLNMISRALAYTQPPDLPGEDWLEVRNPFILQTADDEIKLIATQLQKKHGVSVVIPQRRFKIIDGVLTDLVLPSSGQYSFRPGEVERIVETQKLNGFAAHLLHANDGRWGVRIIFDADAHPSRTNWYSTEEEARYAFTR